jgi:hypothetical protein
MSKSLLEVGDRRREQKSWPGNLSSANDRQAQPDRQAHTNENGLRLMVDFVRTKVRISCTNDSTSKPDDTPQMDTSQPDRSLLIEVMARKGANINSDHMLVVIKLRARICRVSNTKPQQLRRFAVEKLKDRDVASRFYDKLESELQGVQAQPLSLDEKC